MTTRPDPLIGVLVDGRYRVDRIVGEGGFGTVYAAFHVGLGARVALKVPRVDDLAPSVVADAIAMFLEEGRTLKRLRHENLVAALDVGLLPPDATGRSLPYLVLEWAEGPTLKEWLAAHPGPRAPREAWALLRPVFEAIAHAHAQGVAHRDIKPANIILEPTRGGGLVPRVIDFGIAKVLPEGAPGGPANTRTTSVRRAYTPKYAAPEQLAGVRTGPWTDVYALALVLLEVILGRPVFPSDDDARHAMLGSALPTPSTLGLDLGPWQRDVERALDPRPTGRFADAGALLRALDGDAGGAPHPVRFDAAPHRPAGDASQLDSSVVPASRTLRTASPGASDLPPRHAPRRRLLAPVVAAFAVALLAVGSIGAFRYTRGEWPFARSSRGASTSSPSASALSPELRPLGTLTGDELLARASASGLVGCMLTKLPANLNVTCGNGLAILADRDTGTPNQDEIIRLNLQYQTVQYAKIHGASRFAIDGTWGLIVSGPPDLVDGVTNKVLLGTKHGPIGNEKISYADRKIPPRLADWTGVEIAPRLVAAGATVTTENPYTSTPSASFQLGTDPGVVMLIRSFGESFVKGPHKPGDAPYSWARDGDVVLVCYGGPAIAQRAFVEKLVGAPAPGMETGQFR